MARERDLYDAPCGGDAGRADDGSEEVFHNEARVPVSCRSPDVTGLGFLQFDGYTIDAVPLTSGWTSAFAGLTPLIGGVVVFRGRRGLPTTA